MVFGALCIVYVFSVVPIFAVVSKPKSKPKSPSAVSNLVIQAVEINDIKKVIRYVYEGQDMNFQDAVGYSPLHYAAKRGHKEIVALLLQEKVLLNQVSYRSGNTPLLLAVGEGHKHIVESLLKAGADFTIKNKQGYNALHLAIQKHRKDIVELLLSYGCPCYSTTTDGDSPLILAIKLGNLPIVQLLLKQEKIIDVKDKGGFLSLHWAVLCNEVEIFKLLSKHKQFHINGQTGTGIAPLHLIVSADFDSDAFLSYILGVPLLKINIQDSKGNTPLHYAVVHKKKSTVTKLLNYPYINPNIKNGVGNTALHYATYYGYLAILKKMLSNTNVDISIPNAKGVRPFDIATHHNDPRVYKLYLQYRHFRDVS